MSSLFYHRYAVTILLTAIYGCLSGYIFYANYPTRLNPVTTRDEEVLSVIITFVAPGGNSTAVR